MNIGRKKHTMEKQPEYTRYLGSAISLLLGLGASSYIYLTAEDISDSVTGFEESRKYLHDLELYGGKANVLTLEFTNCFTGLWHGKSFAYTLVCITIMLSACLFFADYYSPCYVELDEQDKNKRGGTD